MPDLAHHYADQDASQDRPEQKSGEGRDIIIGVPRVRKKPYNDDQGGQRGDPGASDREADRSGEQQRTNQGNDPHHAAKSAGSDP